MDCKGRGNSNYNREERFAGLAGGLTGVVRHPPQVGGRASMDTGTVQSVVQSNFMRSYRARQESERKMQALPADIQAKLAGMAEGKQLPSYDIALAERMMEENA